MQRGMFVRVGVGDAYAMIGSEGVSYAPDLAHDMALRAYQSLGETLKTAIEVGYIVLDGDDEDDFEELPDGVEGEEEDDEDEEVTDGPIRWWIQ